MKRIFTILFAFFIQFAVCQNSKNVVYVDENNQQMTEDDFESLDERKFYFKIFENDTLTVKKVYPHRKIGALDSIQLQQFKTFLVKTLGNDFNENKKTMIHLYSKNDHIKKDSNYKRYWTWIEDNSDRYQAFLIGTKNSNIKADKENHIYVDSYGLITHLFFRESDFDINHLLLKPNGAIYIYFGKEDILGVLDWSVD
ncbi:MAG TPA: hypothetical protein VFM65_10000 [Flavobacteriaceae bacterium]|nr:hypothetical protein [Flavobacteriaceae bacterium]